MRKGLPAAALIAVAASGCAAPVGMYRADAAHTGHYQDEGPRSCTAWNGSTRPRAGFSAPLVTDKAVYFGTADGRLHAIDRARGTPLWYQRTEGDIEGVPARHGDTLLFGLADGHLYAVGLDGGALRWRFAADSAVYAAPTVGADAVYLGTAAGGIRAVALGGGRERWHAAAGAGVFSSPALAGGVVYVGSDDGHVYALAADSGRERWRFATGGRVYGAPAIGGGNVYVGSADGAVYAIADTASSAGVLPPAGSYAAPAVDATRIYVGATDGKVYALDAASGTRVWRFFARDPVYAPAACRRHPLRGYHRRHPLCAGRGKRVGVVAVPDRCRYLCGARCRRRRRVLRRFRAARSTRCADARPEACIGRAPRGR